MGAKALANPLKLEPEVGSSHRVIPPDASDRSRGPLGDLHCRQKGSNHPEITRQHSGYFLRQLFERLYFWASWVTLGGSLERPQVKTRESVQGTTERLP